MDGLPQAHAIANVAAERLSLSARERVAGAIHLQDSTRVTEKCVVVRMIEADVSRPWIERRQVVPAERVVVRVQDKQGVVACSGADILAHIRCLGVIELDASR